MIFKKNRYKQVSLVSLYKDFLKGETQKTAGNFKEGEIKFFYSGTIFSQHRIGPHQEVVISTIVGLLLGNGYGEKRKNSTRFHVHMSSRNMEYINWLHLFFNQNGYCSKQKLRVAKQIGKNNKIYFSCKFRTFSFSSFNYLFDLFYKKEKTDQNIEIYRKRVPKQIGELLTPRSFAIWIMDDGGRSGRGVKISTENFSLEDNILLQKSILERYNLRCNIQHHKDKYILYFPLDQLPVLEKIVKPHMIPCMYYKLNGSEQKKRDEK